MATEETKKRKLTSHTIDFKLKLIAAVDKNDHSKSYICKEFGIANSTLSTFLKDREKIQNASSLATFQPQRKRMRVGCKKHCGREQIEEGLYTWFKQTKSAGLPVSGPILCEKAASLSQELGIKFTPNSGWLTRFKERKGITFRRVCGEAASVSSETINEWELKREVLQPMFNQGCEAIVSRPNADLSRKIERSGQQKTETVVFKKKLLRNPRHKLLSESEKKQRLLAHNRKKRQYLNIGELQLKRWNALKESLGLQKNPAVAKILLDLYEATMTTHTNDGTVPVPEPHEQFAVQSKYYACKFAREQGAQVPLSSSSQASASGGRKRKPYTKKAAPATKSKVMYSRRQREPVEDSSSESGSCDKTWRPTAGSGFGRTPQHGTEYSRACSEIDRVAMSDVRVFSERDGQSGEEVTVSFAPSETAEDQHQHPPSKGDNQKSVAQSPQQTAGYRLSDSESQDDDSMSKVKKQFSAAGVGSHSSGGQAVSGVGSKEVKIKTEPEDVCVKKEPEEVETGPSENWAVFAEGENGWKHVDDVSLDPKVKLEIDVAEEPPH